jgi:predicted glycosyltransferase
MKILLDILHPAHVHFFRNAITDLRRQGCEVVVTARDKDLTLRLLDIYGIDHECISREASSKKGLLWELLSRNAKLAKIARREKPHVMASIGGISTSQVGFLTHTRNLIFYDTENAWLSNLLSYPFASAVVTPECYRGKVFGRHVTYAGYHELAYLHPRRFTPDPRVLTSAGIDPQSVFSVVRFVSWRAMHDLRAEGIPLDAKRKLIRNLEEYGQVFITSERPLPDDFQHLSFSLSPDQIHHFLAFAHLYAGESATMAAESAILGVPAIYLDRYGRGYMDELESRYGLCHTYRPSQAEQAIDKSRKLLSSAAKKQPDYQARVAAMLAEKIDVTEWIIRMLTDPQPP